MPDPAPVILWFRRDLRLADNAALHAAARRGPVLATFVLDPVLLGRSGGPRRAYLAGCLAALDADLRARGAGLELVAGDPAVELPALAARTGARGVVAAEDFGPYGRRRDAAVAAALAAAGRGWRLAGSPYAVEPGTVRTKTGTPYRVFTPFLRAWQLEPVGDPLPVPDVTWVDPPDPGAVALPREPADRTLPEPGEAAALARLDAFVAAGGLDRYAERRDLPGVPGTSRLSADLRWGTLHPRTVLARLGAGEGHQVFRSELAWREFYADVLFHQPASAWSSLQPAMARMRHDDGPVADERFAAWAEGRTGYPIVDAGMRQLLAEGWMHNRVRMIVASFLVKDLHLPWQRGARHFMDHLVDGDLASNNHGWQWAAGTGTDAAPYFRIFNPVSQSQRFDPDGTYIRRYVPELAHVPTRDLHAPWLGRSGAPLGYPPPIVDHATERAESLARYAEVTAARQEGGATP